MRLAGLKAAFRVLQMRLVTCKWSAVRQRMLEKRLRAAEGLAAVFSCENQTQAKASYLDSWQPENHRNSKKRQGKMVSSVICAAHPAVPDVFKLQMMNLHGWFLAKHQGCWLNQSGRGEQGGKANGDAG